MERAKLANGLRAQLLRAIEMLYSLRSTRGEIPAPLKIRTSRTASTSTANVAGGGSSSGAGRSFREGERDEARDRGTGGRGGRQLTLEQKAVVDAELPTGSLMIVNAYGEWPPSMA